MSGLGRAGRRVEAPAKLTLTLRVLGTRPDGFHELEALTVTIGAPVDELRLADLPAGEVRLEVRGGADDVPRDESNLVVRAARAVLPADRGLAIALDKRIPSGAGLGGGSADAAAVLRVLRDAYDLDPGVVMAAAAGLGSDVPVCVDGRPVMMRGRGEVLDPVALRGELHVVVATPRFALATPPVFRAWDDLGGPASDRRVPAPAPVAHLVPALVNDLEPAAERVEPRIVGFRRELEAVLGRPALLAGSGSSCWAPVPRRGAGDGAGRARARRAGGGGVVGAGARPGRGAGLAVSGIAVRSSPGATGAGRVSDPAAGAASASSSAASCASSSACACGAS